MEIVWKGTPRHDLDKGILNELNLYFEDEGFQPSDIITHTYLITDDFNGPMAHVWGEEGKDVLFAEYHDKAEWVTLDEWPDD